MRLPSALAGALLCISPLLLAGVVAQPILWVIGIIMALSPPLVFLSQVAIHEMTFALFVFCFVVSWFRWLIEENERWFVGAGAFFGLMMATKESWLYVLCIVVLITLLHIYLTKRYPKLSLPLFCMGMFLTLLPLCLFFPGHGVFMGLREFLLGIFSWRGKVFNDSSQFFSWSYYLSVLVGSDWLSLILGLGVPVLLLARWGRGSSPEDRLASYLYFVALGVIVFLSLLPYKTPWLIITATPFLIGSGCIFFYRFLPRKIDILAIALMLIAQTLYLRTVPIHPLQPVASYQGVRELAKNIVFSCSRDPSCAVLVALSDQWPLPFYLQPIYERVAYAIQEPSNADDLSMFRALVLDFKSIPASSDFRPIETYTIHGRRKVRLWVVDAKAKLK